MAFEAGREREAMLRFVVEKGPNGVVVIDPSGIVKLFSNAAARLFGYRPAQVIGKNVEILMPSPIREHHARYLKRNWRACADDILGTARIVVGRRQDGSTFPLELSVGELLTRAGRLYVGFVQDITIQQNAELRIRELQTELLHVSRLSTIGHMSSAIAHELSQPLTAIMNFIKAAKRTLAAVEGHPTYGANELIDSAAEETLRAGAIIRTLRDFAEKGEAKRAAEDLNKLVEESLMLSLVGAPEAGIKTHVQLDPGLPPMLIDKVQIQQVLINLFRNGIEAMTAVDKRVLSVSTRMTSQKSVEVKVSDTGPGFSSDVQERLFQPFVTTKDDGLGIGLTICRSIVEAHGGHIWAVKNQPVGAGFRFQIPLNREQKEVS